MWELDCEESWVLKNWCFWTVVLEKTLESPLDCKEIQLVHPEEDQSWVFIGRTDAEAETPILWPPDAKSWLIWKDPDAGKIEGRRRRGQQKMRWLDGITDSMDSRFGWTPGVGDGQGGLACCGSQGRKESTWLSNWTELRVLKNLVQSFTSTNNPTDCRDSLEKQISGNFLKRGLIQLSGRHLLVVLTTWSLPQGSVRIYDT